MRADLLALLQQLRCATCALQHIADLGRGLDRVLCLGAGLQDIGEDLNQMSLVARSSFRNRSSSCFARSVSLLMRLMNICTISSRVLMVA
jgi:hypothetical protein